MALALLNVWGRADDSAPHVLILAADIIVLGVWFVALGRWARQAGPQRKPRARVLVYLVVLIQVSTALFAVVELSRRSGAPPEDVRLPLVMLFFPLIVCIVLSVVYAFINAPLRTPEDWPGRILVMRPLIWCVIVLGVYMMAVSPVMTSSV